MTYNNYTCAINQKWKVSFNVDLSFYVTNYNIYVLENIKTIVQPPLGIVLTLSHINV